MPRAVARYLLLALLFACACVFSGGEIRRVIFVLMHEESAPEHPFEMGIASRTITSGAFRGDQLLAIDGRPVVSPDQVMQAIRASVPGRRLRLTLSEPSGHAIERFVTVPSVASRSNRDRTAVVLAANILIPAVSVAAGFVVAAMRPLDGNAWLLLAMLLGFSEVFKDRSWQASLPLAGYLWSGLWMSLWPVSTACFAFRFPEPFAWDRRRPWFKYFVTAAAASAGFFHFAIVLLWRGDIGAADPFRLASERAYFVWLASTIAAVVIFFWAPGLKIRLSSTADARRRLRILYVGAMVAFTPAFVVGLYGLAARREPFGGIPWPIAAMTLALVATFPLTLAYVILVDRAMDLRFLVRQSLRYAIAKGGLYAVRGGAAGYALYIVWRNMVSRNFGRTGRDSSIAIQLTAVAVALLLVGRRRVADKASQWIDRKLFRHAYDAEKGLTELAAEAGRFVEVGPLLETVATRIGNMLRVRDIVILLRDGDKFRTAYTTRAGEPLDIPLTSGIASALENHMKPLHVWFENAPAWIRTLSARDLQTLDFMRTELLLPIPGESGLAGIMSLGPGISEAPYSRIDIRLTQSVAAQMEMAIENSRRASKGQPRSAGCDWRH